MDDLQYGLNIGSFPAENESIITYSADVIWHMFGEKNALNDKPWYGQHDEIEKKPRNSWLNFDFNFPVLPSIGITTAYSF